MKKKFDKMKQKAERLVVKLNPGRRSRSRSPNSADPDPGTLAPGPSTGTHDYADPKGPPTALGTTGSVVNEFLAAARDGADLCLPLKAALVGAVKIFEICEVENYTFTLTPILTHKSQRTADVNEQYKNLKSRVAHLGAATGALSRRDHLDPNLKQRLDNIAEYILILQNPPSGLLLMRICRSFSRLTASIEAKLARGTVKRVLESQADVNEVKDLLMKISARIEAFVVSVTHWLAFSRR